MGLLRGYVCLRTDDEVSGDTSPRTCTVEDQELRKPPVLVRVGPIATQARGGACCAQATTAGSHTRSIVASLSWKGWQDFVSGQTSEQRGDWSWEHGPHPMLRSRLIYQTMIHNKRRKVQLADSRRCTKLQLRCLCPGRAT